jgi:branched-chain amino acid transport system substrate-binding protein
MKKLFSILIVFTIAILLVGTVFAQDVVRIGCSTSLTGKLAYEGKASKDGNDFYVAMVNRKGGLNIGGKKYKIDVKYYDDESDINTTTKLVEKLITEDKIDFIYGPYGSGPGFAASAITEKYKKIIMAMSSSRELYERGFKYLFTCVTPAELYFKSVIYCLSQQNPRPKTLALLFKNDLFNKSAADAIPGYCKENGIEIVYNEKFSPGASDFSTELSVIKAKNPDIIVFLSQAEQFILGAKQMKDLKVNPKAIVTGVAVAEPHLVKALGKDAEYLSGPTLWDPTMKYRDDLFGDSQDYSKEFKKMFGYEPSYHAATNSSSCQALGIAMEKAGSLDVERVRNAMVTLDANTFYGRIRFDEKGRITGRTAPLGQILNGKFTIVYPPEIAVAKTVWPKPAWQ